MDSCLLSRLNPHASAEHWLSDFWATHQKEDCDALLWGLLSSALSAPPLTSEHSPANLLYISEQLSLLLSATHELYAPRTLAASGCFFLPPDSSPPLRSILQTIISLVEVDQLFLLGSDETAPHYDLLLLLAQPPACFPTLQSQLTNACEKFGGVTLSLDTTLEIKKLLLAGSLFFQRLLSSSAPIYESHKGTRYGGTRYGGTPIPVPAESPSLFMKAQKTFELYQGRAQAFLSAARLSLQAGLFSQSLFLLHQASEQALQALLESLTGKRLSSHNLPYLLRLSRRFSPLLFEVFAQEKRLLKTLQKAYVGARYDPAFCGSEEDTRALLLRVEELLLRLAQVFESYLNL